MSPEPRKQLGIRIRHDIYRDLRVAAAKAERPMADLLEEALKAYLETRDHDHG